MKLPCAGVNQLVQFPFCLNENVHLMRQDAKLTPSVRRCQDRKEQISSEKLRIQLKEPRKQTTHTHNHSI